jgi:hypothetical protein
MANIQRNVRIPHALSVKVACLGTGLFRRGGWAFGFWHCFDLWILTFDIENNALFAKGEHEGVFLRISAKGREYSELDFGSALDIALFF